MVKTPNLLTQAKYGSRHGMTHQAVAKWIKKGVIVLRDGKIDPHQADRAIKAAVNPAYERGKKLGSIDRSSFATIRKHHEWYKAALAKLDFEEKAGQKVDVEAVRKSAFETGRRIREAMKNISPRIESIIAAEPDVGRVRAILDREIDAALADLSDEFAATG